MWEKGKGKKGQANYVNCEFGSGKGTGKLWYLTEKKRNNTSRQERDLSCLLVGRILVSN